MSANNTTFILRLVVVALYIAAAFIIMFSSFFENVKPAFRYGIGAFFLLYAVFRISRLYKEYKDGKHE